MPRKFSFPKSHRPPTSPFDRKPTGKKYRSFKSAFESRSTSLGHEQVIDVNGNAVAIQGFPPPQDDPTGILKACHEAIMEEIVEAVKEELEHDQPPPKAQTGFKMRR
jgi:hypothetical protein